MFPGVRVVQFVAARLLFVLVLTLLPVFSPFVHSAAGLLLQCTLWLPGIGCRCM